MSTALLYAPAAAHTRQNHPENKQRLAGILSFLEENGVLNELVQVEGGLATEEQLTRVHTREMLQRVRMAAEQGGQMLDADTYSTPQSFELARLAAGSCCTAVDQILTEGADNALALVRPPGHHAERERVGGFCLLNNIAVAARHAQIVHGVQRVWIVDFDVHHGNGTQDIFYDDESVLFTSLHLYHPFFYPGSGSMEEVGRDSGRGLTVNVPFPPQVGDRGYLQALEEVVLPLAQQFDPQLVLVSAGFDGHWQDPLATMALSLPGYATLGRKLVEFADQTCAGRILFVLEGGYHLQVLRYGILNLLYALLGDDEVLDPLGPAPEQEVDVTKLLTALRALHLLN